MVNCRCTLVSSLCIPYMECPDIDYIRMNPAKNLQKDTSTFALSQTITNAHTRYPGKRSMRRLRHGSSRQRYGVSKNYS